MIDLCGPIDHVFCQSFRRAAPIDADDTTSILLRMKEGMSGYLGTMTTTGPGFSFQVFGSKGWVRLEGMTHVAGASSEERRTRLFGTCKFQPVKGEAKVWQAATLDVSRAALEAFAKAAAAARPIRSRSTRWSTAWPRPRRSCDRPPRARSKRCSDAGFVILGRREAPGSESIRTVREYRIPGSSLRSARNDRCKQEKQESKNGSRQRPRPSHLFDARASRRRLGADVDEPQHLSCRR